MRVAVISDVHSNCFALDAVLQDIQKYEIEMLLFLGDLFGYYPWAVESYDLLDWCPLKKVFVKGNHDELIVNLSVNKDLVINPIYKNAIVQNLKDLEDRGLVDWLSNLPSMVNMIIDGFNILLCHGTPANLLNGRYYPDNDEIAEWFPKRDCLVLLGHTHYPLLKECPSGGIIANPGSVGQPRDGNPQPSWMLIDFDKFEFKHKRSSYDFKAVQAELIKMNWSSHAISALAKYSTPIK